MAQTSERARRGAAMPVSVGAGKIMILGRDRVAYAGLLGEPTVRSFGCITVYSALASPLRIHAQGSGFQAADMAIVPPYVPHRVSTRDRMIGVLMIEPESVDPDGLPRWLAGAQASEVTEPVASRMRDSFLGAGPRRLWPRPHRGRHRPAVPWPPARAARTGPAHRGDRRAHLRPSARAGLRRGERPDLRPVLLALPAPVPRRGRGHLQGVSRLEARPQFPALRQRHAQPGRPRARDRLSGLDALQPFDPAGLRAASEGHLRRLAGPGHRPPGRRAAGRALSGFMAAR